MNIFQELNRRKTVRFLSQKDKFNLTGARISNELPVPRISISRPSVCCSSSGNGVVLDLNFDLEKINRCIEDPEVKYLKKHKKLTISSNNKIKRPFDTLMDLLPIVSVTSSMYFLGYRNPNTTEKVFDTVLWALFIIDFFLSFFTEYRDKKKRNVRNLNLIALNYAKGLMIPDLIALIPLKYAGDFKAECMLRLFRLVRVAKIFNFVNINWVCDKISGFIYEGESMAKKKLKLKILTIWEIIKQVLRMFYVTFIIASIWYAFVKFIIEKHDEKNDFIQNFGLDLMNETERFIRSWYYIFTTLATVGYGDFFAINKYEQGFAVILLLAGPTWFAFMMGNAIAYINSLNDLTGKKLNKANLQKWLNSLEYIYKEISIDLKQEIMDHYANLWRNDRLGTIYNSSQENDFSVNKSTDKIFSSLPIVLQTEVLDYLFCDIIYRFKFFFNSFDVAKYHLCRFLQPRIYKKNSVIIRSEGLIEELIFVSSGVVRVSVYKDDYETQLFEIGTQSIIGDYFFIKKVPCSVEYSAKNTVKGFGLPVYAFREIVKIFDLDLKGYEKKLEPLYKKIETIICDTLRSRPEETKEREEAYLGEKITPATGDTYIASWEEKFEVISNEKEDILMNEVEGVDQLLKNCNLRRLKIIGMLKDQISSNLFRPKE